MNEHYGYWLFEACTPIRQASVFIDEGRIAEFPLAIGGEAPVRAGKAYVIMDSDYYEAGERRRHLCLLGRA